MTASTAVNTMSLRLKQAQVWHILPHQAMIHGPGIVSPLSRQVAQKGWGSNLPQIYI